MWTFVLARLGLVLAAILCVAGLLYLFPGAPLTAANLQPMLARLVVTLPLVLMALTVAIIGGFGLGIAGPAGRVVAVLLCAAPPFWLGLLLSLLLAGMLHLLPKGGFTSWSGDLPGAFGSLLLPALALGLPYAGMLGGEIGRTLSESGEPDRIASLRMRGRTMRQARFEEAMERLAPVLPRRIGRAFGGLVVGAALIESLFYLPGLSREALTAALAHDLASTCVNVLVLIAVALGGMLVLGLLQALADPGLRARPR